MIEASVRRAVIARLAPSGARMLAEPLCAELLAELARLLGLDTPARWREEQERAAWAGASA